MTIVMWDEDLADIEYWIDEEDILDPDRVEYEYTLPMPEKNYG